MGHNCLFFSSLISHSLFLFLIKISPFSLPHQKPYMAHSIPQGFQGSLYCTGPLVVCLRRRIPRREGSNGFYAKKINDSLIKNPHSPRQPFPTLLTHTLSSLFDLSWATSWVVTQTEWRSLFFPLYLYLQSGSWAITGLWRLCCVDMKKVQVSHVSCTLSLPFSFSFPLSFPQY